MRGFWDSIGGFLENLGVTQESAAAVARAYAAPTLANIRAVETAFAAEGTSPPPELLNNLYQRYYSSLDANRAAVLGGAQAQLTAALPWLIGGGLILYLLFSNKGKG